MVTGHTGKKQCWYSGERRGVCMGTYAPYQYQNSRSNLHEYCGRSIWYALWATQRWVENRNPYLQRHWWVCTLVQATEVQALRSTHAEGSLLIMSACNDDRDSMRKWDLAHDKLVAINSVASSAGSTATMAVLAQSATDTWMDGRATPLTKKNVMPERRLQLLDHRLNCYSVANWHDGYHGHDSSFSRQSAPHPGSLSGHFQLDHAWTVCRGDAARTVWQRNRILATESRRTMAWANRASSCNLLHGDQNWKRLGWHAASTAPSYSGARCGGAWSGKLARATEGLPRYESAISLDAPPKYGKHVVMGICSRWRIPPFFLVGSQIHWWCHYHGSATLAH